jgi:hypothetical protein
VTLKAILAALAAAAVVAGFCLPTSQDGSDSRPEPKSQIDQIEVGHS